MVHPTQDAVPSTGARGTVVISQHDYEDMRITYNLLRWMMIGLPALLFAVTFFHAVKAGSFEVSISAYYGGAVRDVFVGVLIATAACMVAYRGRFALEDFALNAAGFFAVFVALVPAGLDTIMGDLRDREEALEALKTSGALTGERPAAPENAQLAFTAEEYGWSLRAALTAVALLCAWLVWNEWKQSRRTRDLFKRGGWSKRTVICTTVVAFLFVGLTYGQLWFGPADHVELPGITMGPFQLEVHAIAAILMIASLLVVVASHGWPQQAAQADPKHSSAPADDHSRLTYKIIFGLMFLGAACIFVLGLMFFRPQVVLVLEWYEIFLFCGFWIVETRRVSRYRLDVNMATM
ncbi:hypothetical protein [Arthrobacter sp. SX1312]|uniref:hypothetical protein n=1 Tax=Arthrobacter sp. SX1312 TaxID=2058896 RepID=UPI0015E250B2|nr:hypothetical protein [Arthrobacter sp. SX1312]